MNKKIMDDVLVNVMYHSLQLEEWTDLIRANKIFKQEFKQKLNNLRTPLISFNNYLQSYQDYELTADLSDNMQSIFKLDVDKISELSAIIKDFVDKNTNNDNTRT